jgi:hypothetical protein
MRDQPIATLAELVAPMPVAAFHDVLRARTLHHQPAAGDYGALLDWEGVMGVVRGAAYPLKHYRMYRRGKRVPPLFYHEDGKTKSAAIDQLMAGSASVVAGAMETYVPAIGTLCAALAAELGEHVAATAIATTGDGGALDLHYDVCDLIILQLEGAKRWTIYADPMVDPVRGSPRGTADASGAALLDVELQAGDWLFVPGGYYHQCDTLTERSLHLGVMITPLTAPRILDLLAREMIAREDDRKPLRGDDAAIEAALRQRLIERISRLSLTDLRRLHGDVSVVD